MSRYCSNIVQNNVYTHCTNIVSILSKYCSNITNISWSWRHGHFSVSVSTGSWMKVQGDHREKRGIVHCGTVKDCFLLSLCQVFFFIFRWTKRQGDQGVIPLYSFVPLSRNQGRHYPPPPFIKQTSIQRIQTSFYSDYTG